MVRIYVPRIRLWLARHSVDPADASDVVQDVFAGVLRRLPEFDANRERFADSSRLTNS